jgi:dihydroxy-acid dehydratase
LLRTGDRIRIDLEKCEVNVLIPQDEMDVRRQKLREAGGFPIPASQTPWQEMQREVVSQMDTGAVLEPAIKYQRIARTKGIPRHNH